jgi:hypothetical protein
VASEAVSPSGAGELPAADAARRAACRSGYCGVAVINGGWAPNGEASCRRCVTV